MSCLSALVIGPQREAGKQAVLEWALKSRPTRDCSLGDAIGLSERARARLKIHILNPHGDVI